MNTKQVKAARAICKRATQPGPWTVRDEADGGATVLDDNGCWVADVGRAPDDAHFIAAARALLPDALDEIDKLRELLREMRLRCLSHPGTRRGAAAKRYIDDLEDMLQRGGVEP